MLLTKDESLAAALHDEPERLRDPSLLHRPLQPSEGSDRPAPHCSPAPGASQFHLAALPQVPAPVCALRTRHTVSTTYVARPRAKQNSAHSPYLTTVKSGSGNNVNRNT